MTRTSGQAEGLSRNRKRTTSNSPTSCRHSRGRLPPPPTRLPNLITQSVYLLSISRRLSFSQAPLSKCVFGDNVGDWYSWRCQDNPHPTIFPLTHQLKKEVVATTSR